MAYKTTLKSNLYKGSSGHIFYRKVIKGTRIQIPAGTKDVKLANKLKPKLEYKALEYYYNPQTGHRFLPFKKLVHKYLNFKHDWSTATKATNTVVLNNYIQHGLPKGSPSTIATTKGRVNAVIQWGINRSIETDKSKYTGNTMTAPRLRVFNKYEMINILNKVQDNDFRLFVNFAFYTGARRGELLSINYNNNNEDYIEMTGKTGKRLVKLNSQAKKIYQEANTPWQYKLDYVTKTFKKNLRRLGIKDGRFQDLRRTFGLNLVRGGMPIYQVAKLLGHSKVSQTERNYAPLLVTDIDDFTL